MPTRWIQRRTNSSIHHKNKISYTSIVHSTPISSYVYTSPHQYYDIFGHLSLGDGRQYSTTSSILPHIHIDAPSYAQDQLQLKLLQSYTRCYNTSSSQKHLPFKDCQTVEDAVKMIHVAVEVDGPSHFIGRSRELTGSTILKHRQVASVDGMRVVSIPYWDWNKLKKDSKRKEQYLQDLLRT